MKVFAIFGISTLMSFVSSGVIAALYAWPRLNNHEPRTGSRRVGGAPHVSPFHWPQLPGARCCLSVAADSLLVARRVWRFCRGPPCHCSDRRAFATRIVGHCTGMAVQHMGHGRLLSCDLSRPTASDRSWRTGRRILHPNRRRASPACYPCSHLPASRSAEGQRTGNRRAGAIARPEGGRPGKHFSLEQGAPGTAQWLGHIRRGRSRPAPTRTNRVASAGPYHGRIMSRRRATNESCRARWSQSSVGY